MSKLTVMFTNFSLTSPKIFIMILNSLEFLEASYTYIIYYTYIFVIYIC